MAEKSPLPEESSFDPESQPLVALLWLFPSALWDYKQLLSPRVTNRPRRALPYAARINDDLIFYDIVVDAEEAHMVNQ